MGPNFRGLTGGQTVTPSAATLLINRRKAAVVDLRANDSFKEGHLAKSLNLPAAEVSSKLVDLKLDKENPLILVCDSGSRASSLASKFKKEGFTEVVVLEGGIKAWTGANLPLVK